MGNAMQLFTQLARSAAAGCRRIMRSLICDAKARTWVGHLSESPSVTELLVDIPHLSLRTAAFCAAAAAECGDNMSTRVRVLPLDAAAVLPSGKTNACNGRVENA